jgi:Protein of unknown function (DUF1703).
LKRFIILICICIWINFIAKNAKVWPEFPTGNGKIDIIIKYLNKTYGIELKTYSDESSYKTAIKKAVHYAKQLQIKKSPLFFC